MIRDADSFDDGTVLRADICIVGAGAAGITLALQFLSSGHSVLLLESGGDEEEAATQALYEGEVADEKLHSPPVKYRQRRLGGSTSIWGGRCIPFDPIDFERRDWIPDSGWPFGIDELLPYYPAANALCEAGEFAYTAEAAFPNGMRPMFERFAGRSFTDNTLERFSCPTDFGRRYRHRIEVSKDVRLVLHANVTNIATSDDGTRVDHLDVRTLSGRSLSVKAGHVVLATGGLEVPRLLLASRDHHADGIGNAHDLVGRFYMCHMAGTLGEITVAGDRDSVWHGYDISDEGIYCRRRFALTEAAQRELGVGNFVARLHHPRIPDPAHRTGILSALYLAKPFIGYEYSKRLHGEDAVSLSTWLAHVRNVALDPWNTGMFLLDWARKRTLAERKFPSIIVRSKAGIYSLDVHAEQVPNCNSRVSLTDATDALGTPRINVDWRCSPGDIATVKHAVQVLAAELESSGCGTMRYDETLVEADILRDGAYGGHHIGTARMSDSPCRGVVDADCKVHGVDNLYVASSAVFPTSGQANPTLTIVALSLRLAERLRRLHRPSVAGAVEGFERVPHLVSVSVL
jgi:choline dehydrogenase-like flavoprotein